jgi:hypothetical protein
MMGSSQLKKVYLVKQINVGIQPIVLPLPLNQKHALKSKVRMKTFSRGSFADKNLFHLFLRFCLEE